MTFARPAPIADAPKLVLAPLLLAGLVACESLEPNPDPFVPVSDDDDATDAVSGEATLHLGDEVTCSDPVDGFARFTDEASERGLDPDLAWSGEPAPCFEVPGTLVSSDLDGDGDPDLLFRNREGFPLLYVNDGSGHFTHRPVDAPVRETFGRSVLVHSAVDLDGDGLPEVVVIGASMALVSWNQGDLEFSQFEALYDEPGYPRTCFHTMAWGDLDGDGDLDLLLPGLDPIPWEGWTYSWEMTSTPDWWGGTRDLLLLNTDGAFDVSHELVQSPDGTPGLSILGAFSDRDGDGDLDVLVWSDRTPPMPPSATFRNDGADDDGVPVLVNDAESISGNVVVSGMGLGSADMNGDGSLDYCMSDSATILVCLLSDGSGGFFEAGASLGLTALASLVPGPDGDIADWTGWSLELIDFDNDGISDMAAAAGAGLGVSDVAIEVPDIIWQGQADGSFVDRTDDVGFGDRAAHFGMAADDFDGDGYRDLVVAGHDSPVRFWSNPCGREAWLEVELVGAAGNIEAFGARVVAGWGDVRDIREMHSLRSLGQSDSVLHFGLGDTETVDRLTVRWPDGTFGAFDDVPTRRTVTVRHPDAPD